MGAPRRPSAALPRASWGVRTPRGASRRRLQPLLLTVIIHCPKRLSRDSEAAGLCAEGRRRGPTSCLYTSTRRGTVAARQRQLCCAAAETAMGTRTQRQRASQLSCRFCCQLLCLPVLLLPLKAACLCLPRAPNLQLCCLGDSLLHPYASALPLGQRTGCLRCCCLSPLACSTLP